MRRILSSLILVAMATAGFGCQNATRLACEFRSTYVDFQRLVMGIDYPHGIPESGCQQYYSFPARIQNRYPCDD